MRIHPREGVNKRESVASQHLTRLREAFGKPYANCRFIWPADPVSSYDLGEAADVVLTSWSTIGLEMPATGAPVLVAFNGAERPFRRTISANGRPPRTTISPGSVSCSIVP